AAVTTAEHPRDESLLELVNGIVEVNASLDHLVDEPVEPIADADLFELLAREPAKRLDVLFARFLDDLGRQRRNRRLLVPLDGLEVVADELFVEARLGATGLVDILRPEPRGVRRQDFINEDQPILRAPWARQNAEFEFG